MFSSSEVDAEIRKLEDIFSSPVQLLVPLYQRPYAWAQGRQWGAVLLQQIHAALGAVDRLVVMDEGLRIAGAGAGEV